MKKIILISLVAVILISGIAVAQQIQVLPLGKLQIGGILAKIKIPERQRLIVEDADEQLYISKGCTIVHRLEDALSLECPSEKISEIPNAIMSTKLEIQTAEVEKNLNTLDLLNNEHLNITKVWELGYTGKNRVVAILDTGVDYTHPSLMNDIVTNKSFVLYIDDPMDDSGHGTHITGIITSDGNPPYSIGDVTYPANFSKGVAPDAKIMMAKVCDQDGYCDVGDVIAGLEWAVSGFNRTMSCFEKCGDDTACCKSTDGCSAVRISSYPKVKFNCTGNYVENIKPDVISISLGGGNFINSNCDKGKITTWEGYLAKKIDWAVQKGVVVVAAAGNWPFGVKSPACASKAIAVGADDWFSYNGKDYDVVWDISGRGFSMKDHGVLAPVAAFSTLPKDSYGVAAGTSVSTPFVAGLVSLMKEKNPRMNPSQIIRTIFKGAVELDPNQEICFSYGCYQIQVFQSEDSSYEEGHGKIDGLATIKLLR